MIDDRWLDAALARHADALASPTEREITALWIGLHAARPSRRPGAWRRVGVGIAAVLLVAIGWIGLVPLGLPSFGILDGWRAHRWQARILDPAITVGDRSATITHLTARTPGTELPDLQRLFHEEREPGLRGALLHAAARIHPDSARAWVWEEINDPANADVTRLGGLEAIGTAMPVDSLVLLTRRVPLSVRYGIFEQLREHPDPAATSALVTLARAATERAEREAILAALWRRPADQLHDSMRDLLGTMP